MDFTARRVAEKFDAFEKVQDPTLVYEALEMIEAADRDVMTWDATSWKQAISRRLHFLAGLDRIIDPQWDAEDKPVHGTTPPPTQGIVFGSGEVDPATIPDPAVRAEYERALKESKDYAKYYDVQFQLRRIDGRAMRFVESLLAEGFTASLPDRQVFEELLAASPVTVARKERLWALLPKQDL